MVKKVSLLLLVFSLCSIGCGGKSSDAPSSLEEVYTIGGTVSKLSGTMVLQLNGGNDLTITQNGTFAFTTTLANAADYEVTVLNKPIGSMIEIKNGKGVINRANITDITITCWFWTHPADITDFINYAGENCSDPKVAMDDEGNAIIVWQQSDGSYSQIFISEYRSGSWKHPSSLSDNISVNGSDASSPAVDMDNNGNAIIAWTQNDGANAQIFISEYRSGSWKHPSSLSDNISVNGSDASFPAVAMDDNGNAIIAWTQNDGANAQIFISEYRSGSWKHPSSLSDNISVNGSNASFPAVAMDDIGNSIVAWVQSIGDTFNSQVFKSEYRLGAWTHPKDLLDNISIEGGAARYPNIAMSNNGDAIIVWDEIYFYQSVFKSEYRLGSWTHPSDRLDNISLEERPAYLPNVDIDENGNAIIVWIQGQGNHSENVFKSEYRLGSWTHPTDLSDGLEPISYYADDPKVAMDEYGNSIITWAEITFIAKREYFNDAWNDYSIFNPFSGSHAESPNIDRNAKGSAIITWAQDDGTNYQIYKSEFR